MASIWDGLEIGRFSADRVGLPAEPSAAPAADQGGQALDEGPHWSAWARAAVRLMQARNAAVVAAHHLSGRSPRWSPAHPRLSFVCDDDEVVADSTVIGALDRATGCFQWAWADAAIPADARRGLERVREFGELNDLAALTSPRRLSSRIHAFELAAVAARLLYAAAVWPVASGELTFFVAASQLRRVPRGAVH